MNAQDLDTAYTALAEAVGTAGPEHAQLMLATLALSLLSRQDDLQAVLALIAQAQRLARNPEVMQ